ncbi:MAG: hypothetical protein ABIZ05_14985 [Pseudonocardiaceae bacterium]
MDWEHIPRRVCRVPDPLFATKIPAGRRLSCPVALPPAPAPGAPGGQSDTRCSGWWSEVRQRLRWARCPEDGRLHLLQPAVLPRAAGEHARALCGRRVPADGLTVISGLSWALCITCVCGVPTEMSDPDAGDIAP